ncbi:UDP-glucosyltransferase 2 [Bicyclus anynana]|uniref:UDP-glucosyltransferase 2 n=1 Tax=Bicyclus anynana TaxID=110368 RepID=A0ABM3LZG4_BICAN|nr:UDP-glucosyltransferase 2 [Bicyclus anynana]
MWQPVLFVLAILSAVCMSEAYRILLTVATPSKSHGILAEGLIRHLTEAGHEITYIFCIPPEKPLPGVKLIDVSDNMVLPVNIINLKNILDKTSDLSEATGFVPLILEQSKRTIEHPNVQKLIKDTSQQFDVVIMEFLYNTLYAGFSGLYDCPLIWFSPTNPCSSLFELIDEPTNPAYSVGIWSTNVPPMSFTQRFEELISYLNNKLIRIFWSSRFDNEEYEKHFAPLIRERRNIAPSFETLAYNGSLVLSNSHPSMSGAVRAPQNFISIGGFHIDRNVKPLTQEFQKLMDDAKYGVIYFSMGSNFRSKDLPSEIKRDLLNMFGKLKQTVVWKFEEDLPDRPSNVHIVPWAPQQSILAHKNCIIFITHGGLLSTTETIHYGVPIIGVPVFYDQFVNVGRAVSMGFAKRVDLTYEFAKDLELAIQDILGNPKYTTKVHELSEIYHDRTVPPGKELVHWVEHVIKTRGAPHLRSPGFMIPWYQKLYLDLVLVVLIIVLLLKYTFGLLLYKLKKTNSVRSRKEKNK